MTILLDIDGVLITTPAWQQVEILPDGFMKFNENAVKNLAILINRTKASVVLTTTHRIRYNEEEWKKIFKNRGLELDIISKVNQKTEIVQISNRGSEIKEWLENNFGNQNYVIIDDDQSINDLPANIKENWVSTKPLIGFDKKALEKALLIMTINAKYACPCCGHKTYSEKPNGSYDICPVCFWEDDPIQLDNPDYEGGANPTSLKQAQRNYMKFGACDESMKGHVRLPNNEEPKDKTWKPYE